MKNRQYPVAQGFQILLKDLEVNPQDILRKALLPLDLFSKEKASLSPQEYFRFWSALEALINNPNFPLMIGQAITVESFSPPIFASFCSPNLNTAVSRLAHYKDLVAPIQFQIEQNKETTNISIKSLPELGACPESIMAMEFVFLTRIARLGTREKITPLGIQSSYNFVNQELYEDFLGCKIFKGESNQIVFSSADAEKPFLSANEQVWKLFEPELKLRLAKLNTNSKMGERVKAILMESLASGECSIQSVASKLAMTPRTLQRHLKREETSFKFIINHLRHDLALHYLKNTKLSNLDIAFLLGYKETNSFVRAFQDWSGKRPNNIRLETL